MKYPAYPKYKDSGVEWIGKIPEHWEIDRLKHLVKIVFSNVDKHKVDTEIPVSLCNYVDVYKNEIISLDIDFMEASATKKEIEKYELRVGDVLVTKDSESPDDIAIPALVVETRPNLLCGYHLALLRSNDTQIDSAFLYYLHESKAIRAQYEVQAKGITRFGLSQAAFKDCTVPLPPISEQKVIANYLEVEAGKINRLISIQEQIIELLKEKRQALISHAVTKGLNPDVPMKDSGVEWLGEVPEYWEITKLKWNVSKIGSGKTPKGGSEVYSEKGIIFIRSQNVHFDGLRLDDVVYINESIDSEMASTRVKPGDVLLNITGASIGRCCDVPEGFPAANVNQHVSIIRPIKWRLNSQFLSRVISSNYIQVQIHQSEYGVSREGLTTFQIGNFDIAIPSLEEQKLIADYLNEQTSKIDELIAKHERMIELLKEKRSSLISAAVTGKIDVRGLVQQEVKEHAGQAS